MADLAVTGDEISHLIKQHVAQAIIDYRPFCYGHIANYDPGTHRVRCIIPSMQDDNGAPLLSPWMPMLSNTSGAAGGDGSYGSQVIYKGGATIENPTAGEQVVIALFDRRRGVAVCLGTTFNGQSAPPATKLPDGADPVSPGDVLLSTAKGSLLRMRDNGDAEFWLQGDVKVHATGSADITAPTTNTTGNVAAGSGATGTITTSTGQIVTIADGVVVNIS